MQTQVVASESHHWDTASVDIVEPVVGSWDDRRIFNYVCRKGRISKRAADDIINFFELSDILILIESQFS